MREALREAEQALRRGDRPIELYRRYSEREATLMVGGMPEG